MERKIQFYVGKRPIINLDWGMRWSIVILILYFKLFYLVALPGTFGVRSNIILPTLLGDLLFVSLLLKKYDWLKNTGSWKWLKLFMLFQVVRVLYTWISYPGEPKVNAIKGVFTYTVLLTYFVFFKAAENNYEGILNFIVDVSSVTAALFILQAIIYHIGEGSFLKIYGFNYGNINIMTRNETVRLIASDIVDFSAILSIGCIFSIPNILSRRKRYLINLLLVIIYEFFVSQTRGMLLVIIGTLFITLLFVGPKNNYTKIVTKIVFILGILILSQDIFELVSDVWVLITSHIDYSIYHRIDAYIYYLDIMIRKPLLGIGVLPTRPIQWDNYVLVTGGNAYSLSDVGIAGVGAAMGITGVAFYLFPVFRAWQRFRTSVKRDTMNFVICIGMIFSLISLSLFDAERLIVFVIFLAISDISYQRCQNMYQDDQ